MINLLLHNGTYYVDVNTGDFTFALNHLDLIIALIDDLGAIYIMENNSPLSDEKVLTLITYCVAEFMNSFLYDEAEQYDFY